MSSLYSQVIIKGTWAETQAGANAETMEVLFLLACPCWLTQSGPPAHGPPTSLREHTRDFPTGQFHGGIFSTEAPLPR